MKKAFILIVIVIGVLSCEAQGIEAHISFDAELSFSFNEAFIKEKNISRIDYTFSSKKPNQIIKPVKSSSRRAYYDELGRLKEHYYKREVARTPIEKHEFYIWKDYTLSQRIEKDYIGYFSTFFTQKTDTAAQHYYRASHYNPNHNLTSEKDSTLINASYAITNGNVRTILNKNLIPIRKSDITKDSLGLTTTETLSYVFSKSTISKTYSYNIDGFISEIQVKPSTSDHVSSFKFHYDHNTNLERVEYYRDNTLTAEYEVTYSENGWVNALIEHQIETNLILIQELDYKKFY